MLRQTASRDCPTGWIATEEEDPMAEAYCVKDKKKVEIKNPTRSP